ncbi:MAG: hypothetical protein C4562_05805 [Actinobacteria bacterium]|nr:MAG: hypothetical protein C4562_05805 [Actinomycetota bacterium]
MIMISRKSAFLRKFIVWLLIFALVNIVDLLGQTFSPSVANAAVSNTKTWTTRDDFYTGTNKYWTDVGGSNLSDDAELKLKSRHYGIGTSNYASSFGQGPMASPQRKKVFNASNGTLAILYNNNTAESPSGIVVKHSHDSGQTWQGATQISTNNFLVGGIMDAGNNIYVATSTNNTTGSSNYDVIFHKLTYNAGTDDWSVGLPVTVYDSPDGTKAGAEANIERDASGRLWIVYRYFDGTNYSSRIVYSSDDGATWNLSTDTDTPSAASSYRTALLVSYGTKLACIFGVNEGGNNELKWRWRNNSDSPDVWQTSEIINSGYYASANVTAVSDTNNNIHLLYRQGPPNPDKTMYSFYNGSSWTTEDPSFSNQNNCTMSVKSDGSEVHIFNIYGYWPAGDVINYKKKSAGSWGSSSTIKESYDRDLSKVVVYDSDAGVAYQDETADAISTGVSGDVFHDTSTGMLKDVGDAVYFGLSEKYYTLTSDMSQAGVGGTIVWEYSKGDGFWQSFTPLSGAYNFTQTQNNTVTTFWESTSQAPGDWNKGNVNGSSQYWIRARVTSGYSTVPIGARLSSMPRLGGLTPIASSSNEIFLAYSNLSGSPSTIKVIDVANGGNYGTSGFVGGTSAGSVGLRFDAGSGVKAKWSSLAYTANTLNSGQAIKYKIRAVNDLNGNGPQDEFDAATWYGPNGATTGSNWDTGEFFGQVYGFSQTSMTIPSAIGASRYAEIMVFLESNGNDTPIVEDVSLNYDTLDATDSFASYKDDGTTSISYDAWTNEDSITSRFYASGIAVGKTLTPEMEIVAETGGFTGTATASGTPVTYNGQDVILNVSQSGLIQGNYKYKIRVTDEDGRASAWSTTTNHFNVDQSLPSGYVRINNGADYVTTAGDVTLNISATDPDISTGIEGSGVSQMMVSSDGIFDTEQWESYATTKQYTFSGEGQKTIYIKFKDNAGNESLMYSKQVATTTTAYGLAEIGGAKSPHYYNGYYFTIHSDGEDLVYRSSTDGYSWGAANVIKNCSNTSAFNWAWKDNYLYVIWPDNADLKMKKGIISGNSISLDSERVALDGTGANDNYYSYNSIFIDSNNYIWVASKYSNAADYFIRAKRSASAHDVTSWQASTREVIDSATDDKAPYLTQAGNKMVLVAAGPGGSGRISYSNVCSNITAADPSWATQQQIHPTTNYSGAYFIYNGTDLYLFGPKVRKYNLATDTWDANEYIPVNNPRYWTATWDSDNNKAYFIFTTDSNSNRLERVETTDFQSFTNQVTLDNSTDIKYPKAVSTTTNSEIFLQYMQRSTSPYNINFGKFRLDATSDTTIIDTQSPTIPANLLANGVNATQVQVSWNEATDASPGSSLKYYYLEKSDPLLTSQILADYDDNNFSSVAQIDATTHAIVSGGEVGDTLNFTTSYTYTDNSLEEGKWYVYRIRSADAAGNTLGFYYVNNNSSDDCYAIGRPNFAPEPSTITATPATIYLPANSSQRQIGFNLTVDDQDGRSDLSSVLLSIKKDGASSNILDEQEINTANAEATNFDCTRSEVDSDTYSYSGHYTFANDAPYGDYTITLIAKDSLGYAAGEGTHVVTTTASVELPPAAVTSLSTSAYSGYKADISWTTPRASWVTRSLEGIDKYKVYMSANSGTSWTSVTINEADYYNAHGNSDGKYHFHWGGDGSTSPLNPNTSYQFKVAAIDTNPIQANANEGLIATTSTATTLKPAKPQKLVITNTSNEDDCRLLLSWLVPEAESGTTVNDMPSGNSTNYRIYRSTSADTFTGKYPSDSGMSSYLIKSTNGIADPSGETNSQKRYYLDTLVSSSPTTYYYAVTALDSNNNESDFVLGSAKTNYGYTIATPEASEISVNSAIVSWTTNFLSDSEVIYYKESSGGNSALKAASDLTSIVSGQTHSITLGGLESNSTYAYKVRSKDEFGQSKDSAWQSFATKEFKVTNIDVNSSVSSAVVTWNTNIDSDSHVEYGTTSNLGKVTGDYENTSNHRVILEKLKPGTKYYYQIKSTDKYSNVSSKTPSTFTTKPFKISNINVEEATNSATVSWTTNIESTSSVEYKTAKKAQSKVAGDSKLTTEHQVTIKGLTESTTYLIKLKSFDKNDNESESDTKSFITKALGNVLVEDPNASKINEVELRATSAKISWKTSLATSSWVEYGPSKKYGKIAGSPSFTLDHVVELTNLVPGNTYHYRVKGEDEGGNKYQSQNSSFTALVNPIVEEVPKAVSKEPYSAIATWKTNTKTDSLVEYGKDAKFGKSQGSAILVTDHSVQLFGLEPDTTYHYRVSGVDRLANKTQSKTYSFKTIQDLKSPAITQIKAENLKNSDNEGKEKVALIISFVTDEPASSQVEYAVGFASSNYTNRTEIDGSYGVNHTVLIDNLITGTTYHYRIVVKDKYSNTAKSQDFTILTPRESETALQKVIKALEETFSWIGNLKEEISKYL